MKQTRILIAVLLASLSTAPAMAHSEVAGQSGTLLMAHDLVHAIQANPWLPVALFAVVFAAIIISRINRRES